MWEVHLIQKVPPAKDDFRAGFFPRTVRYKDQAEALAREVNFKGGIAEVKKCGASALKRKTTS